MKLKLSLLTARSKDCKRLLAKDKRMKWQRKINYFKHTDVAPACYDDNNYLSYPSCVLFTFPLPYLWFVPIRVWATHIACPRGWLTNPTQISQSLQAVNACLTVTLWNGRFLICRRRKGISNSFLFWPSTTLSPSFPVHRNEVPTPRITYYSTEITGKFFVCIFRGMVDEEWSI